MGSNESAVMNYSTVVSEKAIGGNVALSMLRYGVSLLLTFYAIVITYMKVFA